ncbi:DUF2254 domain-containing protein [Stutzerimonas nosocomialis]|uniref:DUF2254 domain-containing protein n=1 Tax=Stutzerimonas nosocomialis TaxID=1056496 RepID=A0A5R9QAD1_9GAMM|nr:DUF2254 domain-containing protein [Stutzerimonas nosocomialis]TLX61960.1 DUF2254 domain-containing protein [Stutzerimonas nosocomialis]
MAATNNRLFRLYQRIVSSIAFVPALISLALVLLCVISIVLEMTWLQPYKEDVRLGLVNDADNARLILGTLVGGIISLMVFSFSMVMVVLNSASSTLSPRVIPSLISSRSHQIILGFYLGTIIDSLLLILTIQEGEDITIPSLGIFVALALGIISLCLFIAFIRGISQSIQVDYILHGIFKNTRQELLRQQQNLERQPQRPQWPDDDQWMVVSSRRSGYFKALNLDAANDLLCRHDLKMTVRVHFGFFVMPGHPLFRLSRHADEETVDALLDCFDFFVEEYASHHFFFGFKQMTEIATKALSPGINDPGTAIKATDMLSVLFSERLKLPDFDIAPLPDQPARLYFRELDLHRMLHAIFGPLCTYGKEDVQVMLNLLQAYKNLLFCNPGAAHEAVLLRHAAAVIGQAMASLSDPLDQAEIGAAVDRLNEAIRHHDALIRGSPLES